MSLLDDFRVNIGDDNISPTGSTVSQPATQSICLVSDIRTDIADDLIVATGSITTQEAFINDECLVDDLRLDIGDDGISASGIESTEVAGQNNICILRDLRIDIGDDDVIVDPADSDCREVWCTTFVTTSSYDTTSDDVIIFINPPTIFDVTINLAHTPILGQLLIIKDLKGGAFLRNVVINPSPYLIDGLSIWKLTQNKQSIMITWSGSEWNIV